MWKDINIEEGTKLLLYLQGMLQESVHIRFWELLKLSLQVRLRCLQSQQSFQPCAPHKRCQFHSCHTKFKKHKATPVWEACGP